MTGGTKNHEGNEIYWTSNGVIKFLHIPMGGHKLTCFKGFYNGNNRKKEVHGPRSPPGVDILLYI